MRIDNKYKEDMQTKALRFYIEISYLINPKSI